MFIGHFALGFAAKRVEPRLSLAVLFVSAQLADVLWPVLIATGVEQVNISPGDTAFTPLAFLSYPYSHSLLALVAWGLLLGFAFGRGSRAWALVAALVVSHWALDWITHRPDLPIYPGSAKYGLGLWNSVPATLALESALFIGGLAIYLGATRPRDAIGRWGLWSLVAVLIASYISNVIGPPPPSVPALVSIAMPATLLILVWAWWADRHRVARSL